uniref:Octanoyltransferase n=1 Tax=Candidatus Kentrum sp. MB TaxID=2138164 RepID=A0A450XE06_9GAMM|nr:MAG: lipoyl(octanoyl) transferase [Candidatus Kentron sp. MB]VFK32063.1 MAG: lipoyl(octanoyl) transferase [Candidatus Kentron sp. MB]VFK75661.1 MAG: lipoyl(octanoyl) transferase [Candidatus Kentron sp. MB]
MNLPLQSRHLGLVDHATTWRAMRSFTEARDTDTIDQLWFLEHPPVFTLGQAGRAEHLKDPQDIPIVHTDRGGQVTYHGPGQLVVYVLMDLNRRRIGVRRLVEILEGVVIALVAEAGVKPDVKADRRPGAPGVYVDGQKLAALGLRVRRGCCYHGLSLNVEMDLSPFMRINPCGYPGLRVTQLRDLGIPWSMAKVASRLQGHLMAAFSGKPI